MIYLLFTLLALFFVTLLFFLKLRFVITYDKDVSTRLEFLFFKKKLRINNSKSDGFRIFFEELTKIRQNTLDLYNKFSGKLKIKSLKINAVIASGDPYFTAILYGTFNSAIAILVGVLDSRIGIDAKKQAKINTSIDFNKQQSSLWLELILHTSLFSAFLALTYALFKMVFKGGKNGRKQANRNNKNST